MTNSSASSAKGNESRKVPRKKGLLAWIYRGVLPADRGIFWWSMVPALYITALLMTPAAPLLYRPFVPLPKLEQVHHWKGTIKVVTDSSWAWPGTRAAHRYYIQTEQGEFEFHYGYCGERRAIGFEFNPPEAAAGAAGEIWYDPWYGLLKYELTLTQGVRAGKTEKQIYEAATMLFHKYFPYESYFWTFVISWLPLVGQVWYIKKWLRLRYIKANSRRRRGLR